MLNILISPDNDIGYGIFFRLIYPLSLIFKTLYNSQVIDTFTRKEHSQSRKNPFHLLQMNNCAYTIEKTKIVM